MTAKEYSFKLIMLGASGVGKTCLVHRFCHDTFMGPDHKPTLGFDFLSKKIECDGKSVSLQVWDTAGQEEYKAVTKMYYKDVHGVLLVYDTTDKLSFEKVKFWLDDLDFNGNKMEVRFLVGSKMDLFSRRTVTLHEARKYATERKMEWVECSAKTGDNVAELFDKLVAKLIERSDSDEAFRKIGRSIAVSSKPSTGGTDPAQGDQGYKLHKPKGPKNKQGKCC